MLPKLTDFQSLPEHVCAEDRAKVPPYIAALRKMRITPQLELNWFRLLIRCRQLHQCPTFWIIPPEPSQIEDDVICSIVINKTNQSN